MDSPKIISDTRYAERLRGRFRAMITDNVLAMIRALNLHWEREHDAKLPEGSHLIRMVGGCVRDCVLDVTPKDVDFCTPYTPDQLIEAFAVFGNERNSLHREYEIIPTGLQHGTITLRFPETNEQYEITTLRSDVTTDGRHAEVKFVGSYREDAERRDFTMNAMSVSPQGDLYDYFGGLEDARAGRVRFVGDPEKRITEDYLRILRFYRFSARMGTLCMDRATARALNLNMAHLSEISGERIWAELSKILMTPDAEHVLFHMATPDFFSRALNLVRFDNAPTKHRELMLPEGDKLVDLVEVPPIARLYDWLHTCTNALHWGSYDDGSQFIVDRLTRRLALSREETDLLLALIRFWEGQFRTQLAQAVLNKDIRLDHARVFEHLHGRGMRGGESVLDWDKVPEMPVRGQDLLDLGFPAGPRLGTTMKRLRRDWAQSDGVLTRDELLGTARESLEASHDGLGEKSK